MIPMLEIVARQQGLDGAHEFRFCKERKWRFDYAIPKIKFAVEIEGGIFKRGGGRHNRPVGMIKDMEKYNYATLDGWAVFRFTPAEIRHNVEVIFFNKYLERVLGGEKRA